MKAWIVRFSIVSAALLPLACGDDDGTSDGPLEPDAGAGGVDNTPGGGTGGTDSTTGGTNGEPVTCEPPAPPVVNGGEAGAPNGGAPNGGAPNGGAENAGADSGGAANAGTGGAEDGEDDETAKPLVIAGEYLDNWDGEHSITSARWQSDASVFHISAFSNSEQWVLARNDQANMYFPCLWSRFDWTESDGKLYFCQSAYDADSVAAAAGVLRPDSTAPSERGCGGENPWSELIAK